MVPSETSLPGWQMASCHCVSHCFFSAWMHREGERKSSISIPLFLRGYQSCWIRAPPLWSHLTASFKVLSPSTVTLGFKASTYELGREETIQSITPVHKDIFAWHYLVYTVWPPRFTSIPHAKYIHSILRPPEATNYYSIGSEPNISSAQQSQVSSCKSSRWVMGKTGCAPSWGKIHHYRESVKRKK